MPLRERHQRTVVKWAPVLISVKKVGEIREKVDGSNVVIHFVACCVDRDVTDHMEKCTFTASNASCSVDTLRIADAKTASSDKSLISIVMPHIDAPAKAIRSNQILANNLGLILDPHSMSSFRDDASHEILS